MNSESGKPNSTIDAERTNKAIVVSYSDGVSRHYTAKQTTKKLKVLGKAEAKTANTCTQLICHNECKV